MEKYAVIAEEKDTSSAPEKTGTPQTSCPVCGAEIEEEVNVPKCPKHGTRPFETEAMK